MITKMPDDITPGDRLVSDRGPLRVVAYAEEAGARHLQFHDGTFVTITALDVPVEVSP